MLASVRKPGCQSANGSRLFGNPQPRWHAGSRADVAAEATIPEWAPSDVRHPLGSVTNNTAQPETSPTTQQYRITTTRHKRRHAHLQAICRRLPQAHRPQHDFLDWKTRTARIITSLVALEGLPPFWWHEKEHKSAAPSAQQVASESTGAEPGFINVINIGIAYFLRQ